VALVAVLILKAIHKARPDSLALARPWEAQQALREHSAERKHRKDQAEPHMARPRYMA